MRMETPCVWKPHEGYPVVIWNIQDLCESRQKIPPTGLLPNTQTDTNAISSPAISTWFMACLPSRAMHSATELDSLQEFETSHALVHSLLSIRGGGCVESSPQVVSKGRHSLRLHDSVHFEHSKLKWFYYLG